MKLKVLFNASVILAGLHSPSGGSAKLLGLSVKRKIQGIISEIILNEAIKHAQKVGINKNELINRCSEIFPYIAQIPQKDLITKFSHIVVDYGDAHVLASYKEFKADFLVTLDKKHLLALQGKIKGVNIVSPKELLEILNKQLS